MLLTDTAPSPERKASLKITSAEFVLGVGNLRQLPRDGRKEIAFLGRSNVGKSSFLNKLCTRKSLARSSADPGKTRELNYYLVNKQFYFVDLPGYGYAKVPEQIRTSWGKLIEQYMKSREQLALVVQLIDSRHEPTELDMMMVGWLDYYHIPFIVGLTKSDKLPRSKMPAYLKAVRTHFEPYPYCKDVIPCSSVSGEGKPEMLAVIARHVAG
jgi:GTP-binding protein